MSVRIEKTKIGKICKKQEFESDQNGNSRIVKTTCKNNFNCEICKSCAVYSGDPELLNLYSGR